jgi:hypothetical protein
MEPRALSLTPVTPFHKGQTLTYVVLVDGDAPEVNLRASISNTTVERRDAPPLVTVPMTTSPTWVSIVGMVANAALITLALYFLVP